MNAHAVQHRAVDSAFVIVLGTIALSGLGRTYDGPRYLVVGVIGLLIGAVVGLLTQALRASSSIAIGIGVYVLTCGPVVFPQTTAAVVLPTGATLGAVLRGTIGGWADMVTTEPPLPTVSGPLLVPPFLCGLAAGLLGVVMSRLRLALAPLLPVVGLMTLVILFGTRGSGLPTLYACAIVALTLLWGTLRYRRQLGATRSDTPLVRRLVTPVVLLAVAAGAVLGFNTVVPAATDDRYVLRDYVIPPFDPSQYPSPLSGFRLYEKELRDDVLFTVAGLPAGGLVRLATMDSYDGVVWNVVNGDGGPADGSGVFSRVGSRIAPASPQGERAQVTVTIGSYRDIWLPTPGAVTSIDFAGDRKDGLSDSFRYNTRTSVGVVPAGLGEGDSFTMDVIIPVEPSAEVLSRSAFGSVTLPEPRGAPAEVGAAATEWAGAGSVASYPHLLAILDILQDGAFSDGDPDAGVLSPPGHGAKRLRDFVDGQELVGDAEQYAAAFGLMLRELGIPARVVLGAVTPAENFDGRVTGAMISAWVEVYFEGSGWVPFFPTPSIDSQPHPIHVEDQQPPDGQLLEPPLPQAQPPRPLPPPQAEEPFEDINCVLGLFCFTGLPKWVRVALTYVLPPLLGIGLVLSGIVLAKAVRRRRRRTRGTAVERVSAAWQELLDRLRDHGVYASPFDTRSDVVQRLGGGDALASLAALADAAVFGPGEPTARYARDVWDLVPKALAEVTEGRNGWQLLVARLNPRSLSPDTRTRAANRRRRRAARRPPTPAVAPT